MFHRINGNITCVEVATPASEVVQPLAESHLSADLDLKRMAEWALNYLINTPRPELGYEPVFQCHPLRCPPAPAGHDVVVPCDTDARMNWEWYYMRDITGSQVGRAVEAAFHARLLAYLEADGLAWAIPGSFNEGDIQHVYTDEDKIIHIWGTSKILQALAEDYSRTRHPESLRLAGVVMRALKRLTSWDEQGRCWLEDGMGAIRRDGTVVPNSWNPHPAPLVEALVTYWRATGDPEGLEFARAMPKASSTIYSRAGSVLGRMASRWPTAMPPCTPFGASPIWD